jgi:hypothetical protein
MRFFTPLGFLGLCAACWFSSNPPCHAQQKPTERHARFLALGDIPPFRQEIRDGVRYELEPPPGSIPPREVIPGFGEEKSRPIALRLGRISEPVKVPMGEGTLVLQSVGADSEAAPWLRINRPEAGDFIVLLFRAPHKGTWLDAANLVLPEGAADTVRIINLFPQAAQIVFAGETQALAPGKALVKTIQPGVDQAFQILVPDANGRPKRYYSGNVTQNAGERGLVLIYKADGEMPRRPVKVIMLREPVVSNIQTAPLGTPVETPPPTPEG